LELVREGVLRLFRWHTTVYIYIYTHTHTYIYIQCATSDYLMYSHTVLPAMLPPLLCTAAIRKIIVTLFVK
jgi:hypothetical protein